MASIWLLAAVKTNEAGVSIVVERTDWSTLVVVLGCVLAVIGGLVALQVWSQRRRRRGEEASTYNSEGAEGSIFNSWRF